MTPRPGVLAQPPKVSWLLLHDSRYGLKLHKFSTRRTVHVPKLGQPIMAEDFDGELRDILRFLQVTYELQDSIMIYLDPQPAPEWT